ncbi:unnamed protein product [Dicrocoelium dendriticum]|nr:unnamed protein product [Dicrocoelium dendriticum]
MSSVQLEELCESYSNLKNKFALQPRNANIADDLLQSASAIIEKDRCEFNNQLSKAIEAESMLLFEQQKLQQECEQLSERLQNVTEERKNNSVQREKAMKEITEQTNHIRIKCSTYEKAMGAKFLSNGDSITVFIFNPDGVIQHRMQRQTTEDSSVPDFTASEWEELNTLWSKMKVSDDCKDLLDDPIEWKGKPCKKLKTSSSVVATRTVLASLSNRN